LFFAVTIKPEFRNTPEARRIVLVFRAIVWISTLAAIALAAVTRMELVAVLLLAAGFLLAFLIARKQALAHAAAQSPAIEIDLAAPPERLPGGLIVALLPPCSLIALSIWAAFNWDRLPERFPVHWSLTGPNRWVAASPGTVFGLLASHLFLCLMMVGIAWGVLRWSRRIATTGPRAQQERDFRRRIVQLLIIIEYFLPVPVWFVFFQASAKAMSAWAAALAILGVASFVILIRAGQGGSRQGLAPGAGTTGDRSPDACWKFGLIYFNPADPSILIEKRFGIGYTINFGNRQSWLVLALMLVPLIIAWVFLR
jgi:uncharacterized membrane protein